MLLLGDSFNRSSNSKVETLNKPFECFKGYRSVGMAWNIALKETPLSWFVAAMATIGMKFCVDASDIFHELMDTSDSDWDLEDKDGNGE